MNVKKIFAITLVLLAIFATLNVASAGWFDFLGGSSDGPIAGDIEESSVDYDIVTKISVSKGGDFNYVKMMDWDGSVKIKLTNASDDKLQAIQDAIDNNSSDINVTLKYDSDIVKGSDVPYESNFTLNGDVLNIDFSGDYKPKNLPGSGGEFEVASGNVTFDGENPFTILF